MDFFYDGQTKRYIQQVIRLFSQFKIDHGKDSSGNTQMFKVNCVYGDSDRMAQHIKRGNSENTLTATPFLAAYDIDMQPNPERRQNPTHEDNVKIHKQKFDSEKNEYTGEIGHVYTVKRFMPVPYTMTVNVDLWYTMTDHKLQIAEQIMTLFNPDLTLQTSTNNADWTALTTIKSVNINWNSRGVPTGVDDALRMCTFSFEIPIMINPPVKLKKQKVIEQIVIDMYHSTEIESALSYSAENILNLNAETLGKIFSDSNYMDRTIVTPSNYHIKVEGNIITLLGADQGEKDSDGNLHEWDSLFVEYGQLQENISLLQLRPGNDIEKLDFDFIGRLSSHTEPNKLIWNVDLETIPDNTMDAVDAFVDPTNNVPGDQLIGIPFNGMRLLISENIIPSKAWGNLTASPDDIIEFNGATWSISFDASTSTSEHNTYNNFSSKYLKYDSTNGWYVIPDGTWGPGFWKLNI